MDFREGYEGLEEEAGAMRAYYLKEAMDREDRKQALRWLGQVMREIDKETPFDAVAVTGLSGLLMGPVVADRLGKGIIVVRKEGEKNHSGYAIESSVSGKYVIVDDFISTGATIRRIVDNVGEGCVGICLYAKRRGVEFGHWNGIPMRRRQ